MEGSNDFDNRRVQKASGSWTVVAQGHLTDLTIPSNQMFSGSPSKTDTLNTEAYRFFRIRVPVEPWEVSGMKVRNWALYDMFTAQRF